MTDLLDRVRAYTGRHRLFDRGEAVVVGVSGGPESLCLLHLLSRLAPELALGLHVAHLNHGLRGEESEADAAYVAALAARWHLPCTVGRADLGSAGPTRAGRTPHRSLEEAARLARYRFLAEVAGQVGARTIAVGHNADDQAETVLMHFLRGSGVAGLRGMLPRTDLADYRLGITPPRALRLVRPLLGTPRAEIAAYCSEHGLEPRFDCSNEDRTIYRNRLRHELLPLLEMYNPAIRAVLARTADVMAGEHEVLTASLDAAWAHVALGRASGQPDEVQFDLAGWRALPVGLQRATLREAIRRLRRGLRNINWEHVERAVWLAREGSTGQVATLAAGLALEIGYDRLRIAPEMAPWPDSGSIVLPCPGPPPQVEGEIVLSAPGVTALAGGWQVIVRRLQRDALPPEHPLAPSAGDAGGAHRPVNPDPWTAWLDADVVGDRLVLRPRRPGDRFAPQGLGGRTAALHEFMINRKVPRDARAGWPLLVGRTGLAWVCGLRLDQQAVVRPDTATIWEVRFVRANGEADGQGMEEGLKAQPVSR